MDAPVYVQLLYCYTTMYTGVSLYNSVLFVYVANLLCPIERCCSTLLPNLELQDLLYVASVHFAQCYVCLTMWQRTQ